MFRFLIRDIQGHEGHEPLYRQSPTSRSLLGARTSADRIRIRSTDIRAFNVSYFTVLSPQATFDNELMTLLNIRRRHESQHESYI
jgi:hypothetical protein